jgi:CheY-like chemotaxis protein
MKHANLIQHILMADDDSDHALLFGRILKDLYPEINLSCVDDGQQVIQFLQAHQVDLLFLDLNMPCKNGYECLQEIKMDPDLQQLPIIVYSSSANLNDIQKSFILKADFYMVKPFNTVQLKAALELILSINWKDDPPLHPQYFINNRLVPYTA